MKKLVCLLLVLVLALSAVPLAIATEPIPDLEPLTVTGPDEGSTKYEMWSFSDDHNKFYSTMVDKWNEKNPDRLIQITFTTYPYGDMHTKLLMALQTGEGAPDLCDVEINRFANYVPITDVPLYPLNDALAPYEPTMEKSRLDIYSGADGNRYGVPFHVGAAVMYWNAEIFEKYNLDYKSVKTWDDYTELGRKLKEASGGTVYLTSVDTKAIEWMWIAMAQYGEDWTGGYEGPFNVQLPSVKKMLEMQQMWVKEGLAVITPEGHLSTEGGYATVANEVIASFPKALWYMSRFTSYMPEMKGKYDLGLIPVFEEGQKHSVGLGGTGTVVTNQAHDQALAAEWIAWAKCDEEGQRYIWDILGFDVCNKQFWYDDSFVNNEDNIFNTFFRTKPYLLLQELDKADSIGMIHVTSVSRTLNSYMNTNTLGFILEEMMNVDEALQDAQDYLEVELAVVK